ncbi:MAG: alkaline phosphatase [Planctomycetota bacterium]
MFTSLLGYQKTIFLLLIFALVFAGLTPRAEAAKNVIIMISDGAGYNTFLAASIYQGKVGKQIYDGPEWMQLSCSNYPLNRSIVPTRDNQQDPIVVYDPVKAWSKARGEEVPGAFGTVGYQYMLGTYTDSAAAATAMASGVKTFNNSINWKNDGTPLWGKTVAEVAKKNGRSVGMITTVPWSHATPAGFGGAHNVSRNDYAGIANEMLNVPYLDLLMGAGHPDFTENGKPATGIKDYQYVGGKETWDTLKSGHHWAGWKLIETRAEFELLARDPNPPTKLVGVAQVYTTLQQRRTLGLPPAPGTKRVIKPYGTPLNKTVPTLATMTEGTLNSLSRNANGFYVMIEGGAVDWANHANQPHRLIEEQIDFLDALDAVVRWIDSHGGWAENLVIITADHECGMLWGPNGDTEPFDPIVDHGPGNLPGIRHFSSSHSNQVVPLYARGAGAEEFRKLIVGNDPTAAKTWNVSGDYVDNVSVYKVTHDAIVKDKVVKDCKDKKAVKKKRKLETTS